MGEGTIAKTNATVAGLEAEVVNQEGILAKAEQDRADKDDQIRTLKDEISHQGEMITLASLWKLPRIRTGRRARVARLCPLTSRDSWMILCPPCTRQSLSSFVAWCPTLTR